MNNLKSLYVDLENGGLVAVDDFLVAVGKKQSNSVYHVAEVTKSVVTKKGAMRNHLKVYKSDLLIALKRDWDQMLYPIRWYSRNKKK